MSESDQRPPLAFGGELSDLRSTTFRDPAAIGFAGKFPDYDKAPGTWRAKSRARAGDVQTRSVLVRPHRFLDPAGSMRKPG